MSAILTATALGLGITVYGADKYAPVQITDPSQFPTIKIETNLVLDEATELPANVTIDGTTYGFVEVGLRVTPGAEPYKQLRNVGVVLAYSSKLIPITWTERDPETWTPKEDKEVNSDTGEESTVQNFRFLETNEKYLPAKKADIMDTASARIIGDDGDGWTAFTMVAACDDPVTLEGDSRLMVVRFAYEKIAGVDADSFELTYVTEREGTKVNRIERVTGRNDATGAVESSESVELLRWATDGSVAKSTQAGNSAVLVGAADRYTVYYAHNAPNPDDSAKWPGGVPDTQGYTVYAVPEDGTSTASMLTASAVELPDEPSTVYDTGDDTVYDLTGDTEPETPEEEPEEEELPESEEEEETSFFEELPMLFTSPRAGTAEGSYQTNFFPVDSDYIAGLNDGSIDSPWTTMTQIDAPKIQFVDIHCSTADSGVGGISLDDVVPVIFFDWDDTFLGSTVIARGIDSRENVNNFVRDNLIHPDLRTDFRSGGSLAREFSYRGVEPHKGPGEGDTVTDGEQYPLTNKLDYVFYTEMKEDDPTEFDDPYLFDDGWVRANSAMDMESTWTTLGSGELDYLEGDAAGYTQALTMLKENLIDFKADVENLSNNASAIYVKAAYQPGSKLNQGTFLYSGEGPVEYNRYGAAAAYSMKFDYERMNGFGYGVKRMVEPTIQTKFTMEDDTEIYFEFFVDNKDLMPVEITAPKAVKQIEYVLVEEYKSNFVDAGQYSGMSDLGAFTNYDYSSSGTGAPGSNGFVKYGTMSWLNKVLQDVANGIYDEFYFIDHIVMEDCNFRCDMYGTPYEDWSAYDAQYCLETLIFSWPPDEPFVPTWYQLQYALAWENYGMYASAEDARQWCLDNVDPSIKWFADTLEGEVQ